MRFLFLSSFLLFFTATLPAQETFAPLLTEDTALIIHVDLQSVDVDTFKQNWTRYSEKLMLALPFEALSQQSVLSALSKDLEKFDTTLRPAIETITKKLEIQEVAIITDAKMFEDVPFFLVIPWKDKTDDDLERLLSLFPEEFLSENGIKDEVVAVRDFLFWIPELDNEAFEEWFENLSPDKDVAIVRALNSLDNGDIKIATAMTNSTSEYIMEMLQDGVENKPDVLVNMVTYIARKVDWAAMTLPNPLTHPDVLENRPPMKLTVKTQTTTDAKMLRTMLESAIDLGINTWRTAVSVTKTNNDEMLEHPQFFFELLKGSLRMWLPTVEDDKLVFEEPDFGERFWELYWVMYGGFVYHAVIQLSSGASPFEEDDE